MSALLSRLYGLRSHFEAFLISNGVTGNAVAGNGVLVGPVIYKMAFYERLLTLPDELRTPEYATLVIEHGRHVQALCEERLNALGVGLSHGARLSLNHFREAVDSTASF